MHPRLSTDLVSGLLFAGLDTGALVISWHYPGGTAARMGPGYVPHLVGALLVLLGGTLIVRAAIRPGELIAAETLRPLIAVLAGTLAFGLLIGRARLIVAGIVLVAASRLARPDFRPLEVLALAVVLSVASTLVSVTGLGLT